MFVSQSRPYVPVGASVVVSSGSQRETQLVVYTRWGDRVKVSAPQGAVPYASIKSS